MASNNTDINANEDRARKKALAHQYSEKIDSFLNKRLTLGIPNNEADFIEFFSPFIRGLISGKYNKPSEFFLKNGSVVLKAIPNRLIDAFLYSVDNCISLPYSTSTFRRSLRASDYITHTTHIFSIVNDYISGYNIDAPLVDILRKNAPEDALAYFEFNSWRSAGYSSYTVAYELDREDGRLELEKIIENIILGDNCAALLTTDLILGIIQSNNRKMHTLLGKLLLAARLQEGLRQAICERADSGTVSAFMSLLAVINENDLIRFSSVKRAVGTWLGLIADDCNDLQRIGTKSVGLIVKSLESKEVRDALLYSDDSMEIYIALWAYGFYDINDVYSLINGFIKTSDEGSRHRLLVAGYFCANIDNDIKSHKFAARVISGLYRSNVLRSEPVFTAVFLPCFMRDALYILLNKQNGKKPSPISLIDRYFESRAEAEGFYSIFLSLYADMTKKSYTFSPCVFPWFSAKLEKSDIAQIICLLAVILDDGFGGKVDAACGLLPEIVSYKRSSFLSLLAGNPKSEAQRNTALSALSDRETYTRAEAFKIVSSMKLSSDDYVKIEDMLRFRAEDIRKNVITLLLSRENGGILTSVVRLLSDKTEEKRRAGLDIVSRVMAEKPILFPQLLPFAEMLTSRTDITLSSGEILLLQNILPKAEMDKVASSEALFSDNDRFAPTRFDNDFSSECIALFSSYFPETKLSAKALARDGGRNIPSFPLLGSGKTYKTALSDLRSLSELFELHKYDTYKSISGEECVFGTDGYSFCEYDADNSGKKHIPGLSIWKEWYAERIGTKERLMASYISNSVPRYKSRFTETCAPYINALYGSGFSDGLVRSMPYERFFSCILNALVEIYIPRRDIVRLSAAVGLWYVLCVPDKLTVIESDKSEMMFSSHSEAYNYFSLLTHFVLHNQISVMLANLKHPDEDEFAGVFPIAVAVAEKCKSASAVYMEKIHKLIGSTDMFTQNILSGYNNRPFDGIVSAGIIISYSSVNNTYAYPEIGEYFTAWQRGIISERALYAFVFGKSNLRDALDTLSNVVAAYRENGRQVSMRGEYAGYSCLSINKQRKLKALLGGDGEITDADKPFLDTLCSVYDKTISIVLSSELSRGDSNSEYSEAVSGIRRIYGVDYFVRILYALGKSPLDRSVYYYGSGSGRVGNLSRLLCVCIPDVKDTAEALALCLKGTAISEKRLIEAALYSPEWIDIIGNYLKWDGFSQGCYYFMAHMNEKFDDKRKAVIAKFTPLTPEELNNGAFDLNWFFSAYSTLGEKRFNMIYDAAKYISDGAKHSRARKYSDAALGRLDIIGTEAAISDKRNKDLLMAYSLIPLGSNREDDILHRYLFIQGFLKESRRFGSARMASEKTACSSAQSNLAINAGFADATRLILGMEARLAEDSREMFKPVDIDGISVCLSIGGDNSQAVVIICEKDGKRLRDIPSKIKKNEYIVSLIEAKKALTEQYRRTKIMFEEAMEDETEFTIGELKTLFGSPVVKTLLSSLVLSVNRNGGDVCGFFDGEKLTSSDGNAVTVSDSEKAVIAHPYGLYKNGLWSAFQKYLFANKIVQPFKQVFRELYIKTDEETARSDTLRFSGNQIQPKKTVACLKNRRWVADTENGIQKVYYKENIIARLFALADWFSPADIEAPTLEYVDFTDRITEKPIKIADIPDVIFSEVMRDVDLAVSVAHAGGIDPECSHSTIEMREALIGFIVPMFGLSDKVSVIKSHAIIKGKLAEYTVNLGSGVIHTSSGMMINVLPVHSQHRGTLFLPFADNDPKTAEIISKILLFAEDEKIKDPSILAQIQS